MALELVVARGTAGETPAAKTQRRHGYLRLIDVTDAPPYLSQCLLSVSERVPYACRAIRDVTERFPSIPKSFRYTGTMFC